MTKALTINKVTWMSSSAERPLLHDVSVELDSGDFAIVLGGNGSGKSSLIKSINGLCRPQSGALLVEGRDVLFHPVEERATFIHTLTQEVQYATFGDLTVKENCLLALRRQGSHRSFSEDSCLRHLRSFNPALENKFHLTVKRLSGGERQALALALCLFQPPKLLLLDEHTSALDPKIAQEVMAMTHVHIAQHRITALMTTHHLDDALVYGNRLLVMREGRVIVDMGPEEKRSLTKEDLMRCYQC